MRLNRCVGMTLGVAVMAFAAAPRGQAREFEISWSTLDGGGGTASAESGMEVAGTIGQSGAGKPLRGHGFELTGGFWFGVGPGDCNWDGTVNLLDFNALADCITGPNRPPASRCVCLDMDRDGDVDLNDFAAAQEVFNP